MLPDDDSIAGLTDPLLQPHHDGVGSRIEVQVGLIAHLIWQAARGHCFVVRPNRSCWGRDVANEVLGQGKGTWLKAGQRGSWQDSSVVEMVTRQNPQSNQATTDWIRMMDPVSCTCRMSPGGNGEGICHSHNLQTLARLC